MTLGPFGVVCLRALTGRLCSSRALHTHRAAAPCEALERDFPRVSSLRCRQIAYILTLLFSCLDQKALSSDRCTSLSPPYISAHKIGVLSLHKNLTTILRWRAQEDALTAAGVSCNLLEKPRCLIPSFQSVTRPLTARKRALRPGA